MKTKSKSWSRLVLSIVALLLVGAVGFGSWYGYRLASMPAGPDRDTADEVALRAFIASDDFDRLFDWQKRAYLAAYIDRLQQKSFADLLKIALRDMRDVEGQRDFLANVRTLDNRDDLFSGFVATVIAKYYEQPEDLRKRQMALLVMAQQGAIGRNPEQFGLPTVDQLKGEMVRVMDRQDVGVQNQMAQFVLDIRATRRAMGLADPF